jgi:hypothetical protein
VFDAAVLQTAQRLVAISRGDDTQRTVKIAREKPRATDFDADLPR